MTLNPLTLIRDIINTARDVYADFMWTYTVATKGHQAAEEYRR